MSKWEHFLIAEQEDKTCIQGIPFQGTKRMAGMTTAIESCTLKFFMWTKNSGNECWVILSKLEDCSLINNITASSNDIDEKIAT